MAASTTFSLFFPLPKVPWPDEDDHSSITASPPSSSTTTGSVDCTLSLWTPSSRRAAAESVALEVTNNKHVAPPPPSASWDDVAADHHQTSYYCRQRQQGGKPKGAFADRRCANCGTSSTPLWRNGPRGPKSLCNACGIRFKKEERRAAATAAMESSAAAAGCGYARALPGAVPRVAAERRCAGSGQLVPVQLN